jgi:hypothetical protein
MPPFKVTVHRLGGLAASAAVLALTLVLARDVASQPRDSRSLADRVHALEARVESLERQLSALGASAGRVPAAPPSSANVGAFPLELAEACEPPVRSDAGGLRILKLGCERSPGVTACDPAWQLDEHGARVLRAGCAGPGSPSPSCAVPYRTEADGRRVLRGECLDFGY